MHAMTNSLARVLVIVVSLIIFNLTACTDESGTPGQKQGLASIPQETPAKADAAAQIEPSEQRVRDRANAYLEELRLNHLAGAYRMEAGSLDGSLTPLVFRALAIPFTGTLLSYTITAVTFQGEDAVVDADVSYQLPQLRKPYETKISMHWVTQNGDYYHKLKQPPEANATGDSQTKAPLPGISQGPDIVPPVKAQ